MPPRYVSEILRPFSFEQAKTALLLATDIWDKHGKIAIYSAGASYSQWVPERKQWLLPIVEAVIDQKENYHEFNDYLRATRTVVKENQITKREYFYLTNKASHMEARLISLALHLKVYPNSLALAEAQAEVRGPLVANGVSYQEWRKLQDVDWHIPVPMRGNVKAVVVVEQAFMQQYINVPYTIVVAVKGMPDLGSRAFLAQLFKNFPRALYVSSLDFDAGGLGIFECLKYGSQKSAWMAPPLPTLTMPAYPEAVAQFNARGLIEWTKPDIAIIEAFLSRPWIMYESWMKQSIQIMLNPKFGVFSESKIGADLGRWLSKYVEQEIALM